MELLDSFGGCEDMCKVPWVMAMSWWLSGGLEDSGYVKGILATGEIDEGETGAARGFDIDVQRGEWKNSVFRC